MPVAAQPAHQPTAPSAALPHASPSVRKFARELGVPLDQVKGSGPKGRITQADVQGFVKGFIATTQAAPKAAAAAPAGGGIPGLLAWPQVDFAKFGPVERKDLSRIKKLSGANLHRNWVLIPHVTNNDEADITDLEALRVQLNKENEKAGIKLTMLAFVIKAVVAALKKFPEFNASLDGDALVYKKYFHIGFAADTPNGLVVPVLKDADKKGLLQIAQEMAELSKKARDGKLGPADMTGGCFSISSLGGIGGTTFSPIINAPEVAILGLFKGYQKPVWDGKAFVPRLTLPLSLSYDHRVIDGAPGRALQRLSGASCWRTSAASPCRAGRHTMALIEVKVPDIGDFKDVAVIELLVKPGDTVQAEQSLITVESDKASMEIPSSAAGVVKELKLAIGDKINEGSLILLLEGEGAAAAAPAPAGACGFSCNRGRPQPQRPQQPRRQPPAMPAAPTSNATCWCSAPGRAAIRPPSAPPTWA